MYKISYTYTNKAKIGMYLMLVAAGILRLVLVTEIKVYNIEGKNVAKTIRVVDKNGNTILEQDAKDEFTINTKDLSSGLYGVHVLFEDEGFSGVMFYLFNIQ